MKRETKFVVAAVAAAILLVALVAIIAPQQDDSDLRPSTYNAGPAGGKVAYLLLGRLGYHVERSDDLTKTLQQADAPHVTLIMANPWGSSTKEEQNALGGFIAKGGHVLGTGYSGMYNLPGFYWKDGRAKGGTCYTKPEGTSALAAAGSIKFSPDIVAQDDLVATEVAQRCKDGAVVIQYPYKQGHVVWWTQPAPLTNQGLHDDANLKLFLASVGGTDRKVIFDESNDYLAPSRGLWAGTDGLPLRALSWQVLLGVILLLLSFGRRHGPLRALTTTPRTSPLEFAYSMGNLYYRGKAGEAAATEARGRLIRVIERQCGISREVVEAGPEAIADELRERLNYKKDDLVSLLERTAPGQRIQPAEALPLVQSLNQIGDELRAAVSHFQTSSSQEKSLV